LSGKGDRSYLETHLESALHKEIRNYRHRNMMVKLHFYLEEIDYCFQVELFEYQSMAIQLVKWWAGKLVAPWLVGVVVAVGSVVLACIAEVDLFDG
jgi:hypothetical protein